MGGGSAKGSRGDFKRAFSSHAPKGHTRAPPPADSQAFRCCRFGLKWIVPQDLVVGSPEGA